MAVDGKRRLAVICFGGMRVPPSLAIALAFVGLAFPTVFWKTIQYTGLVMAIAVVVNGLLILDFKAAMDRGYALCRLSEQARREGRLAPAELSFASPASPASFPPRTARGPAQFGRRRQHPFSLALPRGVLPASVQDRGRGAPGRAAPGGLPPGTFSARRR
jgi:hypothetical protein